MTLGVTDMGQTPELGILERLNPATGLYDYRTPKLSHRFIGPYRLPRAGDFTLVNMVSVTDKLDRLACVIGNDPTNGNLSVAYVQCDSTGVALGTSGVGTADAIVCLVASQRSSSASLNLFGLGLTDNGQTFNVVMVGCGTGSGGVAPNMVKVQQWTNTTTLAATPIGLVVPGLFDDGLVHLRITFDGGTITHFISNNGKDYLQLFTQATTFKATAMALVGMADSPLANGAIGTCYHLAWTPQLLGDSP